MTAELCLRSGRVRSRPDAGLCVPDVSHKQFGRSSGKRRICMPTLAPLSRTSLIPLLLLCIHPRLAGRSRRMETRSVGALADASDPRKRTVGTRDRTLRAHERTLRARNGTVWACEWTVGARKWTVGASARAVRTRVPPLWRQTRRWRSGFPAVRAAARPVRAETPAARISVAPYKTRVRMSLWRALQEGCATPRDFSKSASAWRRRSSAPSYSPRFFARLPCSVKT
jgi:hypothetical protein